MKLNLIKLDEQLRAEDPNDDPGDELWIDDDPGDPWTDDERTEWELERQARRLREELAPYFS